MWVHYCCFLLMAHLKKLLWSFWRLHTNIKWNEAYLDTIYSPFLNEDFFKSIRKNFGRRFTQMQVPLPLYQEPDKYKMWGVKFPASPFCLLVCFDDRYVYCNHLMIFFYLLWTHYFNNTGSRYPTDNPTKHFL